MKAIAYTRCAAREIPEPPQSIDHQEVAIKDYCKDNSIELLHLFHDIGVGGLNFKRPGWNDLEAYLSERKNGVEAIIVSDVGRIGRDAPATLTKIAFLEKEYGIKIIPLTEDRLAHLNDIFIGK